MSRCTLVAVKLGVGTDAQPSPDESIQQRHQGTSDLGGAARSSVLLCALCGLPLAPGSVPPSNWLGYREGALSVVLARD